MNTRRITHTLAAAAVLGFATPAALACDGLAPNNPASVYVVHGDGTATDTRNGLMWKQALEPGTMSWGTAMTLAASHVFAGWDDWRLPSLRELRGLVEHCQFEPAINDDVFSQPQKVVLWSSSPDTYYTQDAWVVDFRYGQARALNREYTDKATVRLVRGGR